MAYYLWSLANVINAPISPRIVFIQSARSVPDYPRLFIFLIGQIVVLIASNRPHFLIGPFYQGLFWSREYRISFLVDRPYFCKISREPACTTHDPWKRAAEAKRKPQKAQEGSRGRARQVDLQKTLGRPRRPRADCFDRLLFFNLFKKSSRSLLRYPTLGRLMRSRQILPRRYTLVHVSARRFPTYFAKLGPID